MSQLKKLIYMNQHVSDLFITQNNKYWLFNCGEGTQHALNENKLRCTRIEVICITKLSINTIYGLNGLISMILLFTNPNQKYDRKILPYLYIIGPSGIIKYLLNLFNITQTFLNKIDIFFIEINNNPLDNTNIDNTHPLDNNTINNNYNNHLIKEIYFNNPKIDQIENYEYFLPYLNKEDKYNDLLNINCILKYPLNNKINLFLEIKINENNTIEYIIKEITKNGYNKNKLIKYHIENKDIIELNNKGYILNKNNEMITSSMIHNYKLKNIIKI
ncbi:hypothetical protein ABK040_004207 [Willaertia magna]